MNLVGCARHDNALCAYVAVCAVPDVPVIRMRTTAIVGECEISNSVNKAYVFELAATDYSMETLQEQANCWEVEMGNLFAWCSRETAATAIDALADIQRIYWENHG